jgi:putative oxidoreductase
MKLKALAIPFIAAIFIFLFTYTALSKFLDFTNFKNVLHQSPLIGKLSSVIAWTLPLTELAAAVLLFFPHTRLIGLYTSLALMIVFTIYIGYMIAFTPHLPCSCGGVLKQLTWKQHLGFNVFFTVLAAIALWLTKQKPQHEAKILLQ